MKFESIEKKFTELVASYLAKGYQIHISTLEHRAVDLAKDNELVRVWYKRETVREVKCIEAVKVMVGIWKYPADTNYDVWEKDINVIEEHIWYVASEKKSGKWYVDNLEEAKEIYDKQYERRHIRGNSKIMHSEEISNPKAIEIAIKYLRRKGIARIYRNTIEVKRCYNCKGDRDYCIIHKGKLYYLEGGAK